MLYSILIVILILAFIANASDKKTRIRVYWAAVLILIVFSACRDAFLYPDMNNYYDYFKYQSDNFDENFGYGYQLLNDICRIFSTKFQFELAFFSIITVGAFAMALLRHMTDFWPILAGAVCSAHPCYSQRTLL